MHRTNSVWSALGLTAASVPLPGIGWVFAGRRRLGLSVIVIWLLLVLGGAAYVLASGRDLLSVVVTPSQLTMLAIGLGVLVVAWMVVLIWTYRLVRPEYAHKPYRVVGRVGVGALCLVVAAPLVLAVQYSLVQRDLVTTVFNDALSATRPSADPENPWEGTERVNVLLVGGDGNVHREGIRTDTMIVASIDTQSGDTTLLSVPRNLMDVPFPEDSPLHKKYPDGFIGEGPTGEWMLNAVYRNVPQLHPGILGKSDNEGADALKQALHGALGIPVDYYVLVNLEGFEKIVDAIGGVAVNINQPIPIGGNTDAGIPPEDYLEPGPNRELNGFQALWFARGRYGLSDYNRMERQRCVMKAIIDEADPLTLIRRYRALADAGKKIVRTDIPQAMLPAFVDLGLKVKDAGFESVVFEPNKNFNPGDPDYDWLHRAVQKAIKDAPKKGDQTEGADAGNKDQNNGSDDSGQNADEDNKPDKPADPCAYNPVE